MGSLSAVCGNEECICHRLNRLGKYASRQELLDEIRDLNLDLEREKKMLETYRHRYEAKQGESFSLTKNLDSVKEYQGSLMKEHKVIAKDTRLDFSWSKHFSTTC